MGNHNLPELLAPAGGLTQLRAAVNNGADAVYLGGSRFNARAKADNFTLPRLRDAIRYAHERNVKIYVTFNTLLKDRELPDALDYAGSLWDIGADAVIVQDMGLVRMLRKYLPDLPLHLSTQGTVTGKWAVDLMKDFGIRRIVPARELSIRELREMAQACHGTEELIAGSGAGAKAGPGVGEERPHCELEVFVHGALCMCYSGQCQMSRVLGASGSGSAGDRGKKSVDAGDRGRREGGSTGSGSARSGNRGLCAQPCRLPYTDDQGRAGYFLSPKDLCLLEDIPALCEAGVDSLKIEGRLKSPEYVAVVVGIYRKYLDEYARTGVIRVSEEDRHDLTQIYSRGEFTKGYLYGNPGMHILSGESPKNTGIYVGDVRGVVNPDEADQDRAAAAGAARKGAMLVDVALKDSLEEGDGVEFRPVEGRGEYGGTKYGRGEYGGAGESRGEYGGAGESRRENGGAGESRRENGGARYGDRQVRLQSSGGVVTFRHPLSGGILRIGDMKGEIRPGDGVFRVTQRTLLERARESFDAEEPEQLDRRMARRIPIRMRFTAAAGQPAELEIQEMDSMSVHVVSQEPMEQARNKAAEPERIRQQLAKLGGTPFVAASKEIDVALDGQCAVPVSVINRMRREGISQLLQEKGQVRRAPADPEKIRQAMEELTEAAKEPVSREELTRIPGRLMPLMEYMGAPGKTRTVDGKTRTVDEKTRTVDEKTRKSEAKTPEPGEGVLPYIDEVSKGGLDAYIEAHFEEIVSRLKGMDCGILIRTSSWIRQFLEAGVRVYGGRGLNVYNRQALLAWRETGTEVLELSLEAADPASEQIPLMITECPVKSKTLTDRKGKVHRIERTPAGDKTIIW